MLMTTWPVVVTWKGTLTADAAHSSTNIMPAAYYNGCELALDEDDH